MKPIFVFCFFLMSLHAYSGDSIPNFKVSLGVGAPNLMQYNSIFQFYKDFPDSKTKGKLTFHAKFEYKLKPKLGLGLNINFMSYQLQYPSYAISNGALVSNEVTIRSSGAAFNFRANYYFKDYEKLMKKSEWYAGMGIGYNWSDFNVTSQYEEFTPTIVFGDLYKLSMEATIGFRYRFNKRLAVYSEAGFAKSIVQLGLTGSF